MTAARSLSTPEEGRGLPQPTSGEPPRPSIHTVTLVLTQHGFPKVSSMGP